MSNAAKSALPRSGSGGGQPRQTGDLSRFDHGWFLFFAALGLLALLVLVVGQRFTTVLQLGGFTIQVSLGDPYGRILQFLADGVLVTLRLTLVSFLCILIVGMIGGLGRVSGNRFIGGIAALYVEIVRGIPVLVWLLWIWFALPQLSQRLGQSLAQSAPQISQLLMNLKLQPLTAAVVGLTFAYGAYMTEIFRAGIQSIPRGQMEAARSLGMNYLQSMRYIILPQAVRVILPPMSNEFVTLLKDTSLVSILAVSDLTRRGREFVATTFLSFDTFTMVALLYLIMTLFFTRVSTALERRLAVERR